MQDLKDIIKKIKNKRSPEIKYSEYIAEQVDKNICYVEYIAGSLTLDKSISYLDYLIESFDKSISYSKYICEKI